MIIIFILLWLLYIVLWRCCEYSDETSGGINVILPSGNMLGFNFYITHTFSAWWITSEVQSCVSYLVVVITSGLIAWQWSSVLRGWLHETGTNSDRYQSENILKYLHETGMKLKSCSCKHFSPHSELLSRATIFFLFFALSVVDMERFRVFMKTISYRDEFEPVWTRSCWSSTWNEWDRSEVIFRTGLM